MRVHQDEDCAKEAGIPMLRERTVWHVLEWPSTAPLLPFAEVTWHQGHEVLTADRPPPHASGVSSGQMLSTTKPPKPGHKRFYPPNTHSKAWSQEIFSTTKPTPQPDHKRFYTPTTHPKAWSQEILSADRTSQSLVTRDFIHRPHIPYSKGWSRGVCE